MIVLALRHSSVPRSKLYFGIERNLERVTYRVLKIFEVELLIFFFFFGLAVGS